MRAWRAHPMGRVGGVAAVLLTLGAAPGCAVDSSLGGQATDAWVRTYELPANGTLELRNRNGLIEVEGSDASTLEVRAERIVKSTSDEVARDVLARLGIQEDVSADRVSIRTQELDGIVIGVTIQTRYHVRAPRGLTMNLRTANGGIRLADLDGSVVAQATNGGIIGTDIRGGLDARTTNGGVRIDVAKVGDDPIDLRTTNGGIVLGLPDDAAANLSLSAVNGGVSVNGLPFEPSGEQTRRRIRGRLNGGGAPIELTATNGGVRVRNRMNAAEASDEPEP